MSALFQRLFNDRRINPTPRDMRASAPNIPGITSLHTMLKNCVVVFFQERIHTNSTIARQAVAKVVDVIEFFGSKLLLWNARILHEIYDLELNKAVYEPVGFLI